MYDYRNDPLPGHKRWQTKGGKIVLGLAQINSTPVFAVNYFFAITAALITHLFYSNKISAIVGVIVYTLTEIVMSMLISYYGLRAKKFKYSLAQRIIRAIFLALLVLLALLNFF